VRQRVDYPEQVEQVGSQAKHVDTPLIIVSKNPVGQIRTQVF
jgi:hypothetical protein